MFILSIYYLFSGASDTTIVIMSDFYVVGKLENKNSTKRKRTVTSKISFNLFIFGVFHYLCRVCTGHRILEKSWIFIL